MNVIILINGQDVTETALLQDTRINYDTTRRITTASITVMGRAFARLAKYDSAHYDKDAYALTIADLYEVTILDGRDGTTKLFDGQISTIEMVQADTPTFDLFYKCSLNDWTAWLDRTICYDSQFNGLTFPASDQQIITTLIGHFLPAIKLGSIASIVPTIQAYQWLSKSCRQVLDDMAALSMGEWGVDFNATLYYRLASNAPAAPYALSTSADNVTSFPVKVDGYKHDFSNPINQCFVRGAVDSGTGVAVQASYSDPVSVQQYGTYAQAIIDTSITTAYDASLKAKSTVLQYAYPVETGNFTVWGYDWLKIGMAVSITEDNLGLSGTYIVRALTMQWTDKGLVQYAAQFGAMQPDLETLLRLIAQRTAWASAQPQAGVPVPGSVTNASIGPGGLTAQVIGSVNASSITGQIQASQIGTVNASTLVGQVQASQITTVNATSIQGAISAGQIGSVNATTIQGVIVSSQVAAGIVDSLSKYAAALRPVPIVTAFPTLPNANYPGGAYFYNSSTGYFYQVSADGTTYAQSSNPSSVQMNFYAIGMMSASSITGLIAAAQIGSITAGQITGQVQASQINTVNASQIVGTLTATQIGSVNATAISGLIQATQINTVNATQIAGSITASQITSVNASTINGGITSGQITTVNAGTITLGSMSVGGTGAQAINVYNGSSGLIAQIGVLSGGGYGGWFQVFGAGGTNYSTANVYTDTGGNLFMRQVSFNMTVSSYSIIMTPSTFDPSYSTLSIQVSGGGDAAWHVSRGMLLYTGSTYIGSFVRAPSGGAQLELGTATPNYILAKGGIVRADAGFAVAGVTCVNSSGQWVGAGVLCTGYGVACAGINPYVGGVQYNGVTGPFTFKTTDGYTITVAGGCIVAHSP